MPEDEKKGASYILVVIRGVLSLLAVFIIIFLLAGRLDYWQGWVFSAACIIAVGVQIVVFADKADLVKERRRPGPGTKWWDYLFWAFYVPMFIAVVVVACLDSGRYLWSGSLPHVVYIFGYALFILSQVIVTWSMWTNAFFSSMVRIQEDRGQVVIRDGPYQYVRHPGYAGGIMMAVSFSLVLGSMWALVPATGVTFLLIIRTYLEDAVLIKELPGYTEYVQKVKSRLLPGVW